MPKMYNFSNLLILAELLFSDWISGRLAKDALKCIASAYSANLNDDPRPDCHLASDSARRYLGALPLPLVRRCTCPQMLSS